MIRLVMCIAMAILLSGCEDTDVGMAIQAGADAVRAITLDDDDLRRLAEDIAAESDRRHVMARPDHPQARRLAGLTDGLKGYQGQEFDFKVYLSPTVNAFAMADGTIRIYGGLMDMMTDDELLFVIGHEMGHVVENHVREKIVLAYAGSAVRKAIASQQNEAGQIARSVFGALAESLLNAQFSQKEEREADDFGVRFLESAGGNRQAAVSALTKLATLGGDHSFLSSHPAPEARAKRLQAKPDDDGPPKNRSWADRSLGWLKRFLL
ncbi:MAG: peptidase M48 [Deltaproteobacteria bacterium]|nr:peptidase M48 [Deltaproteobacteria bacterium]